MKRTMKMKAAALAVIGALLPCGIHASAEVHNPDKAPVVTVLDNDSAVFCKSFCVYSDSQSGKKFGKETNAYCVCVSDFSADDQGRLTDEEFAELKALYEKMNALLDAQTDDDLEDNPEFDALWDRIYELEDKAGYYDPVPADHGNLTDAEYEELKSLYEKLDALYDEESDEDSEWDDNPELDSIWDRIEELEEKSGWYDDVEYAEDFDITEKMTDEEKAEYEQILARLDEIDGLIFDGNEDMTDEEIEAAYAPYEAELDALCDRLDALYEKVGIDAWGAMVSVDESDLGCSVICTECVKN